MKIDNLLTNSMFRYTTQFEHIKVDNRQGTS